MKKLAACCLALMSTFGGVSQVCGKAEKGKKHPHVVVLIIDDAGSQDVGFSSKLQLELTKDKQNVKDFTISPIHTPFLDSLAQEESILFPQYYTHPTCTPSRSALMTGKYAFKVGMPFPIVGPGSMIGLDPSLKTMANYFQDAGYSTHMVGKWHLGHAKKIYRPPRRGFDTFMGCVGGGFDHYTKSVPGCLDLWNTTQGDDDKVQLRQFTPSEIDTTQHATELFSDEAVQLIRQHDATKPFFLYLSYTSPHAPLQADERFVTAPECKDVSNKSRRLFCAMMLQLDRGIQRVVDAMKENHMWDDTYFLFTTDNGGMPIVGGFNYPYRGAKAEAWDGAVRGPALFRFPRSEGVVAGVYHGLVHIADWLPTLTSATGLEVDLGTVDGVDHFQAFQSDLVVTRGTKPPDVFKFPRTTVIPQADMFLNVSAVRDGCHKLILGAPGFNQVYEEPSQRLFKNATLLHSFLETLFPLIEMATPPVASQMVKYALRATIERWYALLEGTKYYFDQVTFIRSHSLSTIAASYQDEPITVQWNAHPGPMVFLYNVCDDPSESTNVALQRKQDVARLYEILSRETSTSPVQYAGDVSLKKARPSSICSPFLEDDTVIFSSDERGKSLDPRFVEEHGIARRFFVRMVSRLLLLLFLVMLALVTVCIVVVRYINKTRQGTRRPNVRISTKKKHD